MSKNNPGHGANNGGSQDADRRRRRRRRRARAGASSARATGASATTSSSSSATAPTSGSRCCTRSPPARSTPTSTRSAIAATATAGAIATFCGSLESIDREARQVILAPLLDEDGSELIGRHAIRYDYLVIAVGSVTNDFGTPGVRRELPVPRRPRAAPTASATACSTTACACRAR